MNRIQPDQILIIKRYGNLDKYFLIVIKKTEITTSILYILIIGPRLLTKWKSQTKKKNQ